MGVRVREKPPGSGIYWIFINHNGKRKSKRIGTDEDLANEVAKKIEARLILGDLGVLKADKIAPTFSEYCELWLEDYIKQTKRNTTYVRYSSLHKKYIKSQIGSISIDKIKRSDVRNALLSIYKKGLSKSTVSTARNVISGTFECFTDISRA